MPGLAEMARRELRLPSLPWNEEVADLQSLALRQAMGAGAKERLGGMVEIDETFLGGSRSGVRGRCTLAR
jgi:hypothetical protein